ncbi:hypothetical protein GCM10008995_11760 [Halobellus salinus]|uniref:Uncharacterized protein n=1 Tax=Halobellus salinus TaxID=931585 RepID=A0A830E9J2_9EURY|nr:hypothetical protein GCM10008995_11760 [Halobellus salinus]
MAAPVSGVECPHSAGDRTHHEPGDVGGDGDTRAGGRKPHRDRTDEQQRNRPTPTDRGPGADAVGYLVGRKNVADAREDRPAGAEGRDRDLLKGEDRQENDEEVDHRPLRATHTEPIGGASKVPPAQEPA